MLEVDEAVEVEVGDVLELVVVVVVFVVGVVTGDVLIGVSAVPTVFVTVVVDAANYTGYE